MHENIDAHSRRWISELPGYLGKTSITFCDHQFF